MLIDGNKVQLMAPYPANMQYPTETLITFHFEVSLRWLNIIGNITESSTTSSSDRDFSSLACIMIKTGLKYDVVTHFNQTWFSFMIASPIYDLQSYIFLVPTR